MSAPGPLPDEPELHPVLPLPLRPLRDGPVLEHAGRVVDRAALLAATAHALSHLRARGVRPGDRIALTAEKGLAFIAVHLACLRLGAIALPLNPAATPDELTHALADAGARLHLHGEALAAAAGDAHAGHADAGDEDAWDPPDLPTPAPHDVALLLSTSGTTGRPKGVPITHAALRANTLALHAAWGWSARDVLVHALPLFHVHGLCVALHGALAAGARTLLLDRFDAAEVLACLAARRATLFMGVPTMHHRLATLPAADGPPPDLSALRLLVSGSAPLRPDTAEAVSRRLGAPLVVRYGLSEALMVTSERPGEAGPRPPGGVGRALPGVSVRVVAATDGGAGAAPDAAPDAAPRVLPPGEEGEVQVAGPSVFPGYWRRPDASAAVLRDGWLATGDRGVLLPDGTLRLLGRTRELILSGGFNVYPAEVEAVLDAHDEVAESAVYGEPDEDLGERVAAAVVPAPGAAPGLADRLVAHCRSRLAAYKCPRRVTLRDALPRNAVGKVQRAALRSGTQGAGAP